MNKIRVLLLAGGQSMEHKVSLLSAASIEQNIDLTQFELHRVGITENGRWYYYGSEGEWLRNIDNAGSVELCSGNQEVLIRVGGGKEETFLVGDRSLGIDVVFCIIHGGNGEDGSMQGMLQLCGIPYVGPRCLSSAICMDKEVTKRLLADAGIGVVPYKVVYAGYTDSELEEAVQSLGGYNVFVKPANLGSSVGVSRVTEFSQLKQGIDLALRYDRKVLIEQEIRGRELECAVFGGFINLRASAIGEIIPHHSFYSYEAKYLDADGAALVAPAKISAEVEADIKRISVATGKILMVEGLSRVDFFMVENSAGYQLYVNEINTLPGFTKISMYPRLWNLAGMSYSELITGLIRSAMEP